MIIDPRQTALLLLRLPLTPSSGTATTPESIDLTLTANGQTAGSTTLEESKEVSDALFSVNSTNLTKSKLELIDRTAEALGIKRDDFADNTDFVATMRDSLRELKLKGGDQAILALERHLGLDELGIKITDIIDSASDPDRDDKVTEALKLKMGIFSDSETGRGLVAVDEIGIYRIRSA
ncbi:hypothetical protein ASD54_03130 [Rhizobium sp. Root149]|uniref:hypothetical protein n=1 Tax=Rhizobium sp. Root149 TaxID=1736473 RepID=UPI000713ECBF|nr:hypothetical protein [Rhizobium sp. Root149]KQZ63364.1 hypothetical protein ASD54_03130 [Rhizobium sp. Root149]